MFVSAAHVITLVEPVNASTCIISGNVDFEFNIDEAATDHCELWSNITGTWSLQKYLPAATLGINTFSINFTNPNTVLWGVVCNDLTPVDRDWSTLNHTMTITDAPYCAVLSAVTVSKDPNKGSMAVLKTQLSNTNGINLENQDCNVYIEDSGGFVVKRFDTLMSTQETDIQIDQNGNWINIANKKAPLTDSGGNYVYDFEVGTDWAWVGDEYTVNVICNGQKQTAKFNVTSMRLLDTENFSDTVKKSGGQILGMFIVAGLFALSLKFILNKFKK